MDMFIRKAAAAFAISTVATGVTLILIGATIASLVLGLVLGIAWWKVLLLLLVGFVAKALLD